MAAAAFSGYAIIATTGTAVQLRSTANTIKGGFVRAHPGNQQFIQLGPSTVTNDDTAATAGCIIPAGEGVPISGQTESNVFYINGTIGDRVYFCFWAS